MNKKSQTPDWGLLPKQVKQLIHRREWENTAALKARLSGRKPFPIRIGLKPPSARMAINDIDHFQKFISKWRAFSIPSFVQWETKNFRDLSEQSIPKFLILHNVQELIEFIGAEAVKRKQIWTEIMSPLLHINNSLYPALVKHLEDVEKITLADARLLANLIPQLSPNMGKGCYLRALPLTGVDTKFLENHKGLIADILDRLHDNSVSANGDLTSWLGCSPNPNGWLTIRSLCQSATVKMGGFPIVQITGRMLRQYELPAANILVVENMQSGLGLPKMENTIAVIGGGKNVSWLEAAWLKNKRTAYWGDIDTWGLLILSDVRYRLKQIEPLMMDLTTVKQHEERMAIEPTPVDDCPHYLTKAETHLFEQLKSGRFKGSRLEQERLSTDYIRDHCKAWLAKLPTA